MAGLVTRSSGTGGEIQVTRCNILTAVRHSLHRAHSGIERDRPRHGRPTNKAREDHTIRAHIRSFAAIFP